MYVPNITVSFISDTTFSAENKENINTIKLTITASELNGFNIDINAPLISVSYTHQLK